MSASDEAVASTLRVEGEMTIYRAAELKPELLAALDASVTLRLDLSGVTELDTAGVQILMMLKAHARANERTLELVAHSPAVLEVFELLNLAAYFGDQLLIATPRTAH